MKWLIDFVALLAFAASGFAGEVYFPQTFRADVTLAAWTNTPLAPSLAVTNGGTLAPGTNFYALAAQSPMGISSLSPVTNAVTTNGSQAILISWARVPGATNYLLYRSFAPGPFSNFVSLGTITNTVDAGITAWRTNTFVATATNEPSLFLAHGAIADAEPVTLLQLEEVIANLPNDPAFSNLLANAASITNSAALVASFQSNFAAFAQSFTNLADSLSSNAVFDAVLESNLSALSASFTNLADALSNNVAQAAAIQSNLSAFSQSYSNLLPALALVSDSRAWTNNAPIYAQSFHSRAGPYTSRWDASSLSFVTSITSAPTAYDWTGVRVGYDTRIAFMPRSQLEGPWTIAADATSGADVVNYRTTTNLIAQLAGGAADNLGNHTATGALNMANHAIENVGGIDSFHSPMTFSIQGVPLLALHDDNSAEITSPDGLNVALLNAPILAAPGDRLVIQDANGQSNVVFNTSWGVTSMGIKDNNSEMIWLTGTDYGLSLYRQPEYGPDYNTPGFLFNVNNGELEAGGFATHEQGLKVKGPGGITVRSHPGITATNEVLIDGYGAQTWIFIDGVRVQ